MTDYDQLLDRLSLVSIEGATSYLTYQDIRDIIYMIRDLQRQAAEAKETAERLLKSARKSKQEIQAEALEEAASAAKADPYAVDDPPADWLRARASEIREGK